METVLDGPTQPPLSCGKPKYLVVLLHAGGSSGDEVIELALDWAPTLGKAEFLAPNGPWPSALGGSGFQWPGPAATAPSGDGLDSAAQGLNAYIDAALAKRKLDASLLALVGFGQGAALALRVGLERGTPLGAVVAVGGGLHSAASEASSMLSKPPVLLVEAETEPTPDLASLDATARVLGEHGISVQRLAKPGTYHGLDDDGIAMIADYLHRALVPAKDDAH